MMMTIEMPRARIKGNPGNGMGKEERLQPVTAKEQRAQEAACRLLVAAACARRERRLGSCDVEEVVLMLRRR